MAAGVMRYPEARREEIPAGKRVIKETRWGNTNAYVGGRFWKTIGPTYAVGTDEDAASFLAGDDD